MLHYQDGKGLEDGEEIQHGEEEDDVVIGRDFYFLFILTLFSYLEILNFFLLKEGEEKGERKKWMSAMRKTIMLSFQ